MVISTALMVAATAAISYAAPAKSDGPTVRQLVETVDISGLALSPDEKWLVYRETRPSVESNRIELRWMIVPVDRSRKPRILASAGEPILETHGAVLDEEPRWSADGKWLYYRALSGGEIQLWRASPDHMQAEQVSFDAANVRMFTLMRDGRHAIYATGPTRDAIREAEQKEYDQGIRFDRGINPGQAAFRGGMLDGRMASQRNVGEWFGTEGLLDSEPARYKVIALDDHGVREASSDEIANFDPARRGRPGRERPKTGVPSPQGKILHAKVESGSTTLIITERDKKTGASVSLDSERYGEVVSARWTADDSTVILGLRDRYRAMQLYRWAPGKAGLKPLATSSGLLAGGRTAFAPCAVARTLMACVHARPGDPPVVETISLATGRQTVLATPNADIAPSAVRPIEWRDSAGHVFTGQYFPAKVGGAAGPVPLFITYYVCSGYLRGGQGDEWPLAALAQQGIASLCINNRTALEISGQENISKDYEIGMGAVQGAIDHLTRTENVDRARVGMGGFSFGGEVMMWTASRTNLLAALSLGTGIMEPTYYWFTGAPGLKIHEGMRNYFGLGAPEETPEAWKEQAPALRVDRLHAPLLMQLPEQEYRYSLELVTRLSKTPTPVELYIYPEEYHAKVQPRHKQAVYERNIAWFKKWLKPGQSLPQ